MLTIVLLFLGTKESLDDLDVQTLVDKVINLGVILVGGATLGLFYLLDSAVQSRCRR